MKHKDIELLNQAVEFDLVRYNDEDDRKRYKSLLELHMNKYKYFISKGYFKTQEDLTNSLIKYRDFFKNNAEPNNLLY